MTMATATRKPRNTMASRLARSPNPGYVILKATRKRLLQFWYEPWCHGVEHVYITSAIQQVDLCISRVNSTLEV